MSAALIDLVKYLGLVSAEQIFPPTATFKGVHDSEGHVDVNAANDVENRGVERLLTTRHLVEFLWKNNQQPVPPKDIHDRGTHTLDERHWILVLDESDSPTEADRNDERILILDKKKQLYDCNTQNGIQSRGIMAAIHINNEVIMKVRDQACSCPLCLEVAGSDDCLYSEQMGCWKKLRCDKVYMAAVSDTDQTLLAQCQFFDKGELDPADRKIFMAYVSPNNRDVRFAIAVSRPKPLPQKKDQNKKIASEKGQFKKGEIVVDLVPLEITGDADRYGRRSFKRKLASDLKSITFMHRLSNTVIPWPMDNNRDRFDYLDVMTDSTAATHIYKIRIDVIAILQKIVNEKDAATKASET